MKEMKGTLCNIHEYSDDLFHIVEPNFKISKIKSAPYKNCHKCIADHEEYLPNLCKTLDNI